MFDLFASFASFVFGVAVVLAAFFFLWEEDERKKCRKIDSLLGDLSASGIEGVPDLVYKMRLLLGKIEGAIDKRNKHYTDGDIEMP